MKKLITLSTFFLFATGSFAQFSLVKDINPNGSSIAFQNEEGIILLNDILYFSADDGIHGIELWRSDGTDAGTWMVKDINEGTADSEPIELMIVNETLFFFANDGDHGDELWVSDGTELGTTLVKDVNPGTANGIDRDDIGSKQQYHAIDNVLYFVADVNDDYDQLWRSDGTEMGTTLVKNVCTSCTANNFSTNRLVELNGELYFFSALDMWKSDGSDAGTVQITDHNDDGVPVFVDHMVNVDGILYLGASSTSIWDNELWVSDGTKDGTFRLKDIVVGSNGSAPRYFTKYKDWIYFIAEDFLYRTDGTESGTEKVNDFKIGNSFSSSEGNTLFVANDLLFFPGDDGNSIFYYSTDGTAITKLQMIDYNGSFEPVYPVEKDGKVYYIGENVVLPVTFDTGIVETDGTESGTNLIPVSHPAPSVFRHLTVLDNALYFFYTGDEGAELWKYALSSPPLTIDLQISNAIQCFGDSDGALSVMVGGGQPSYTYTWNSLDAQGSNPDGLSAGDYAVTVTDTEGNSITAEITLTEPAELVATVSSTPATPSQADGTAQISVDGGTPPYTYNWNDTQNSTTSTIANLEAGTYSVTVIDANGCTLEDMVTVETETGIHEVYSLNLRVIPTLSDGSFKIHSEESISDLEVFLTDTKGEVVRRWNGISSNQIITVEKSIIGLHFLLIRHKDQESMMIERILFNR